MTAAMPRAACLAVFALTAGTGLGLAQDADRLAVPPRLEQSFQSQVIGGTPDWRQAPGEPIRWRLQETTPSGNARIQFETVDPERYATERRAAAGRSMRDRQAVPQFGIRF